MASIRVDHQFLVGLGLGHLDPRQQDMVMRRIYEVLELRAGFLVAGSLTTTQQETFERLLTHGREDEAEQYLESAIPDYALVVRAELDRMANVIARSVRHGAVEMGQPEGMEEADA